MEHLDKIKKALGFLYAVAFSLIELEKIWKKVGPEVKEVLGPVLEQCKKFASNATDSTPTIINNK